MVNAKAEDEIPNVARREANRLRGCGNIDIKSALSAMWIAGSETLSHNDSIGAIGECL
jgi:hypothetical protein